METEKIALVTGANKGIGLEVCRQLAKKGIGVVLTARNEENGKKASDGLSGDGLDVVFHQLDVTDEASIQQAADYVLATFGKLNILVNNAGIGVDRENTCLNIDIDKIKEILETNTFGPLRVCKAFIPLMQKSEFGRIVNVSSGMGSLTNMGIQSTGYRLSKLALNGVTRILAKELENTNILINSMAPGWVKTDMGGPSATRTLEEGADTVVWLATADNLSSGGFFQDRKEIQW